MAKVYISIGSNLEPERYVRKALDSLSETFGPLSQSPVYKCPAKGFAGPDFLNLVVCFATDHSPQQLNEQLKTIETACARDRGQAGFANRTLDLDLLLYDDLVMGLQGLQIPRKEILEYAFVLRPLADLAPNEQHPELRRSYGELWARFDGETKGFVVVDLKPSSVRHPR